MNTEKSYFGKLILAGEYGVVAGGAALSVPLPRFSAQLAHISDIPEPEKKAAARSVSSLRNLLIYISALPRNSFYAEPDIQGLDKLIKNGYFVRSSIPHGYGVGSSGAVSALIYDQFFHKETGMDLLKYRKDLATIESCFHGKSSGVDALTSFTGKALHFKSNGNINIIETDPLREPHEYKFFLLDSGEIFDTGPLVKYFLERMEEDAFRNIISNDYLPLVERFINAITGESSADTALIFRAISDLQWNHFRRMIPENMEDAWINGQVSNTYYLKLNGSGGGFMLGIAHPDSLEAVETMISGHKIIWL